jgi:DsbC/DsbD-like thiol-disulfide interchange protein
MIKQFFRIGILAAAVMVLGAAGANAQSVSGSIANGSLTRGTPARATVVLSIPGGLHVNSSRPSGEYMIPTRVTASAAGVRIGPVVYPRGRDRKFEFSEHTINVYEGRVVFTFPVTVPASYRGDSVVVRVAVKFQACSNEACFAPKTKNLKLKARVQ